MGSATASTLHFGTVLGYHGTGDERADAWNAHQPLASGILFGELSDLARQFFNALIKQAPVGGQAVNDPYYAR